MTDALDGAKELLRCTPLLSAWADSGVKDVIAGIDPWLERLPKVELHLHLEGAIPHHALWELCQKYGGDPTAATLEDLKDRFQYRDFSHFIEVWIWKNGFLREYEDFIFVAEAVARDLVAQRISYAEVFFSPPDFSHHGLETQGLAHAIRTGLSKVPEVEVALVADLVRDHGPDQADVTLSEVEEVRDEGIVGVGLGGSEQDFPATLFKPIFHRARNLGFRTSAHAGEAAGAGSVWEAVRHLRVDRIGHGTRAMEDRALIDHLVQHQVPLEMCPGSNVQTGVVDSISDHPIRSFFEDGLLVTVNTDDPAMFGTSLAREYAALMQTFGFSHVDIQQLVLNAIEASWLDEEPKVALSTRFQRDSSWQR
jgi:adenosine deaminase